MRIRAQEQATPQGTLRHAPGIHGGAVGEAVHLEHPGHGEERFAQFPDFADGLLVEGVRRASADQQLGRLREEFGDALGVGELGVVGGKEEIPLHPRLEVGGEEHQAESRGGHEQQGPEEESAPRRGWGWLGWSWRGSRKQFIRSGFRGVSRTTPKKFFRLSI